MSCRTFYVIHKNPVVQSLVQIVQIFQQDVLLNVRLGSSKRHQEAIDLHLDVVKTSREETPKPEAIPLFRFECRSLVEERVVQNVRSAHTDFDGGHKVAAAAVPLTAFLGVQFLDRIPRGFAFVGQVRGRTEGDSL